MTQAKTTRAVDRSLLRALGHPLRLRILHELNARVTSPSDLAKDLDQPLANVSYHIKVLRETEAIELVKTEQRRGALEHYYRATIRPELSDDIYAQLPASSRRKMAFEGLKTIWEEISAAAESHGFSDPRTHLSLTPLELDKQAFEELSDHLAQTLELAMRLQAESYERGAGAELESHQLAILRFERASPQAKQKSKRRRRSRKGR